MMLDSSRSPEEEAVVFAVVKVRVARASEPICLDVCTPAVLKEIARMPVGFGFADDGWGGRSKSKADAAIERWRSEGRRAEEAASASTARPRPPRPAGGKPAGGKPAGGKLAGGKPAGGKPAGKQQARKKGRRGGSAGGSKIGTPPTLLSSGPAGSEFPPGWIIKTFRRSGGASVGSTDQYWYSPASAIKFRSRNKVNVFLATLTEGEVGGDETLAWETFRKRGHRA